MCLQEEINVADEAELHELIALARSQLPAELTGGDAPSLGYAFDSIPLETGARGEKRKRIMIDNLEMEGGIGGHVNVMRNVRSSAADVHNQINELQYLHKVARVKSMDGTTSEGIMLNMRLQSLYLLCLPTHCTGIFVGLDCSKQ